MASTDIASMPISELIHKVLPVANSMLGSIAYYKQPGEVETTTKTAIGGSCIVDDIIEENQSNKLIIPPEVFLRLLGLEYFQALRSFKFALSLNLTYSTPICLLSEVRRLAESNSLIESCKQFKFRKENRAAGNVDYKYTKKERPTIVTTLVSLTTTTTSKIGYSIMLQYAQTQAMWYIMANAVAFTIW
ncbi:MAG: hypothetical protein MHMPM18_002837 [Marteilia pararefringens]